MAAIAFACVSQYDLACVASPGPALGLVEAAPCAAQECAAPPGEGAMLDLAIATAGPLAQGTVAPPVLAVLSPAGGWSAERMAGAPVPGEAHWPAAALTWPGDIWGTLAGVGLPQGEPRFAAMDFTAVGVLDRLAVGGGAALSGSGWLGLREILLGWFLAVGTALGLLVLRQRRKRQKRRTGYGSSKRPGSRGQVRRRNGDLAPSPSPLAVPFTPAEPTPTLRGAAAPAMLRTEPEPTPTPKPARRSHRRRRKLHTRHSYAEA